MASIKSISLEDWKNVYSNNQDFIVTDIRTEDEFDKGHIKKAINDFIIFALAIWAINSDWTTKYSGYSKLIGGIIKFLIGIMLLFFPNILF